MRKGKGDSIMGDGQEGLSPAESLDAPSPSAVRLSGAEGLERVTGIEPAFSAWEADVLPLNYTRRRDYCTLPDAADGTEEAGLDARSHPIAPHLVDRAGPADHRHLDRELEQAPIDLG